MLPTIKHVMGLQSTHPKFIHMYQDQIVIEVQTVEMETHTF